MFLTSISEVNLDQDLNLHTKRLFMSYIFNQLWDAKSHFYPVFNLSVFSAIFNSSMILLISPFIISVKLYKVSPIL